MVRAAYACVLPDRKKPVTGTSRECAYLKGDWVVSAGASSAGLLNQTVAVPLQKLVIPMSVVLCPPLRVKNPCGDSVYLPQVSWTRAPSWWVIHRSAGVGMNPEVTALLVTSNFPGSYKNRYV